MPTIQIEAQLSQEQLLEAVEQMSESEFEAFLSKLFALRAQHDASRLSPAESELLLKINQGVPADLQRRFDELISKRQASSLTQEEYEELLRLTDQVEKLDAERAERLAELARLRQTSLTDLMQQLGIRPPDYA